MSLGSVHKTNRITSLVAKHFVFSRLSQKGFPQGSKYKGEV